MTSSGPRCRDHENGSATIWVLACGALLLAVAYVAVLRSAAVLARHRAEAAADLAALAAAGRIGVDGDVCGAARSVATANAASLRDCRPALGPDGRSGTVVVTVLLTVHLPVAGRRQVIASARAGRDPAATQSGRRG